MRSLSLLTSRHARGLALPRVSAQPVCPLALSVCAATDRSGNQHLQLQQRSNGPLRLYANSIPGSRFVQSPPFRGPLFTDEHKKQQRRLQDKVVLVTGGGGAIGREIAVECSLQQATVVVADTNASKAAETVKIIKDRGGVASMDQLDVSREKEVQQWIDAVVKRHGRVNGLVNNAAAFIYGTIEETTEKMWDEVLAVNIKAVAFCSKYAIIQMKKQGAGGSIVNIGSVCSYVALSKFVPYNSTKGAILQMTRCLALDNGPDGIRVNLVAPGVIDTPSTTHHAETLGIPREELVKDFLKNHFIKRLGCGTDVAYPCIYLLSDESTFVTGADLHVDAGFLAQ